VVPQPGYYVENTLDEPVWETLKRDLFTIGRNLRSVLIPVNWDFGKHQAALHNWDLWGPLVGGPPGNWQHTAYTPLHWTAAAESKAFSSSRHTCYISVSGSAPVLLCYQQ
jgi:hypothetical protein